MNAKILSYLTLVFLISFKSLYAGESLPDSAFAMVKRYIHSFQAAPTPALADEAIYFMASGLVPNSTPLKDYGITENKSPKNSGKGRDWFKGERETYLQLLEMTSPFSTGTVDFPAIKATVGKQWVAHVDAVIGFIDQYKKAAFTGLAPGSTVPQLHGVLSDLGLPDVLPALDNRAQAQRIVHALPPEVDTKACDPGIVGLLARHQDADGTLSLASFMHKVSTMDGKAAAADKALLDSHIDIDSIQAAFLYWVLSYSPLLSNANCMVSLTAASKVKLVFRHNDSSLGAPFDVYSCAHHPLPDIFGLSGAAKPLGAKFVQLLEQWVKSQLDENKDIIETYFGRDRFTLARERVTAMANFWRAYPQASIQAATIFGFSDIYFVHDKHRHALALQVLDGLSGRNFEQFGLKLASPFAQSLKSLLKNSGNLIGCLQEIFREYEVWKNTLSAGKLSSFSAYVTTSSKYFVSPSKGPQTFLQLIGKS